jgi:HPt (histidine-containing phosphotransfer) domain-containing protein
LKVKTPGTTAFKIRVMDKYHFLKNHHQEIIWDIALSASLLILLFYNFFIFISTRDKKYGVYCLYLIIVFFGQSLLITGWFNHIIMPKKPILSNNFALMILYWQASISIYLTAIFLNTKHWMPKYHKILIYMAIIYFVFGLLALHPYSINLITTKIFYPMIQFFTMFVLLVAAAGFYYGHKSKWTILKPAKFYLPAYGAYLIGAFILTMVYSGTLPFTHLSTSAMKIGVLIELIILSLGLADIINDLRISEQKKAEELAESNLALEELNLNLENKVEERTQQLSEALGDTESLLHNMKQGVFVVSCKVSDDEETMDFMVEDKVVSSYSKDIFEIDIKGSSLYDLLYSEIDLKSEQGVHIKTALECSFGMDDLQWSESHYFLPTRVQKKFDSKTLILKISYNPLWDQDGNMNKLMIVAEDITLLEKLENEMKKQKDQENSYHKILQELAPPEGKELSSHMKQVKNFIISTKNQISEIIKMTKEKKQEIAEDPASQEAKIILRHLHTIKGNSRSIGLATISTSVHEIENDVNQLKSPNGTFSFDAQEAILDSLTKFIIEDLSKYVQMAKNIFSIGLQGNDDKGNIHYIEVHKSIIDRLKMAIDEVSKSFDKNGFDKIKDLFQKLTFTPLEEMLQGFELTIQSLSESLNKQVNYTYDGGDILLSSKEYQLLNDSLNHILRNSIDHAFETEEERKELHKNERGNLSLLCQKSKEGFTIIIKDDGRGINTSRLVEKALEKNLIKEDQVQSLSEEDKINLIFSTGLSTQDQVSHFSGRGIGMDVVKTNLESLQGSIEVKTTIGQGSEFFISIKRK